MDRMGHALVQTTQKYVHTLPDTDQKNLDAPPCSTIAYRVRDQNCAAGTSARRKRRASR
jgi:hypothetical protein